MGGGVRIFLIMNLYQILGLTICSYKKLERVTKDVGKRLVIIKGKNITFEDCEKLCDKTNGCQSFGYCTVAQNCHLFDKKLDGSEPLKPPNGCFTNYKICKSGNSNKLYQCNIIEALYY